MWAMHECLLISFGPFTRNEWCLRATLLLHYKWQGELLCQQIAQQQANEWQTSVCICIHTQKPTQSALPTMYQADVLSCSAIRCWRTAITSWRSAGPSLTNETTYLSSDSEVWIVKYNGQVLCGNKNNSTQLKDYQLFIYLYYMSFSGCC